MSVYTDLLFMHGHIANVELARQLAVADNTSGPAGKVPGTSKVRLEERSQVASVGTECTTARPAEICSNR